VWKGGGEDNLTKYINKENTGEVEIYETEGLVRCMVEVVAFWSQVVPIPTYNNINVSTHLQSVPITTNVVSSNPTHDELYSIQHYVIKFVSDVQQVGGFLRVLWSPPPISMTATI
jgi:hypothetical protein